MITGGGSSVASPINLQTIAAAVMLQNRLAGGDANPDFEITGDGKLQWGAGGASAPDTDLHRPAAGQLQTDNDFYVGSVRLTEASSNTLYRFNGGIQIAAASGEIDIGNANQIRASNGSAALGFYNHAPVLQPAAPVTLADVIAVIRGCGLSA